MSHYAVIKCDKTNPKSQPVHNQIHKNNILTIIQNSLSLTHAEFFPGKTLELNLNVSFSIYSQAVS